MARYTLEEIRTTYAELTKVQDQIDKLKEREAYLESVLFSAIPANTVKAGIYHKVSKPGRSVSWAQAGKRIITELVPKTKRLEAYAIVEEFTKETKPSHKFEIPKVNGNGK